mmetsp:Transcript_56021/g.126007  ORF Transcript_56021/g.126007 Transcript_56021/m.126007 type:complete len:561 (+) Transcript_56021:67-1749(+)
MEKLTSLDTQVILATRVPAEPEGPVARAARVFCSGPLLDAVQRARVFKDSKTFVDMPLKDEPETVLQAFLELPAADKQDPSALLAFVQKWFMEAGSDCEVWNPPDYQESPSQLLEIKDADARSWALEINKLWSVLGRKQSDDVLRFPQRHSMIPRTFPMIVPGGRFRETYYWDTYWIVRGLLICSMVSTATGIVQAMLDVVKEYGFYPNGGRIYYLDRSQPPLLAAMVREVYRVTQDRGWLAAAVPVLEKEHEFWMQPHHTVMLPSSGSSSTLNVFRSARTTPRPESYLEDVEVATRANGRAAEDVFYALASGAESGWDFSTRWLEDGTCRVPMGTANLATIDTPNVIPVDLNCFLYDMEKTIASFRRDLDGEASPIAGKFEAFASQRALDMFQWLWNGDAFRDYRLDISAASAVVSLSDWAAPLWVGLLSPADSRMPTMIASLKRSGILRLCGCPVTAVDTQGETQWDAPNAWPPLMHMLIEGLDKLGSDYQRLADSLAWTWLRSNHTGWKETGTMREKYDVYELGMSGGGGEYEPQVGFGWTNGVALALLVRSKADQL